MSAGDRARFRLFTPILAGARWRDRVIACIGALLGIAITAFVCTVARLGPDGLPAIVAPIGASAVLVFAVPASPLAQPWPVAGGNTLSALVGVLVAQSIPVPTLAAGVAVGAAILVMSLLRCLHPPGGAAALTAVIGGPAVTAAGYALPGVVAVNSVLLVALGWLFHRVSRQSYPHRAKPAPSPPIDLLHREDIDRALADMGEAFDIGREDLDVLLQQAEAHAAARGARGRSQA